MTPDPCLQWRSACYDCCRAADPEPGSEPKDRWRCIGASDIRIKFAVNNTLSPAPANLSQCDGGVRVPIQRLPTNPPRPPKLQPYLIQHLPQLPGNLHHMPSRPGQPLRGCPLGKHLAVHQPVQI